MPVQDVPEAPAYVAKVTATSPLGHALQGSAVFIAPRLLLTCRHVIWHPAESAPASKIRIHVTGRDRPIPATIRHSCDRQDRLDLAVLEIPQPIRGIRPPPWRQPPHLKPGDTVVVSGYPEGEFSKDRLTIESAVQDRLTITGPVSGGTSGGVVECWDHPDNCCVALVQAATPTANTSAIMIGRVEKYLKPLGIDLPRSSPPPPPLRHDTAQYLEWLRKETSMIDLGALNVGRHDVMVPIEKLWVPARTRLPESESKRGKRNVVPPRDATLIDALNRYRTLVVEGEAGSGKSTFLRRVAYALVGSLGGKAAAGTLPLNFQDAFPIFLRVTALEDFLADRFPRSGPPPRNHRLDWIADCLGAQHKVRGLDSAFFAARLAQPDTVFLLDGLDEAAGPWRPVLARLFDDARTTFPCRMVLTLRPETEHSRRLLAIQDRVPILDMSDAEVHQFLEQWSRHVPAHDEASARAHAESLRRNLDSRPAVRRMARNPLMLTILASLTRRSHRLPEQRAALFERVVEWLASSRCQDENEVNALLRDLSHLALQMIQRESDRKYRIDPEDAAGIVAAYRNHEDRTEARHFLADAQHKTGLITERSGGLAFWHRSFQEYLAARRLKDMRDDAQEKAVLALMDSRQSPEVLRLLAGCLEPGARDQLGHLFQILIERELASNRALEVQAYAVGVIGGMLADLKPVDYRLPPKVQAAWEALRADVMRIFDRDAAAEIAIAVRVDAADALAQGGDPRLRLPHQEDYWVTVPGGTFIMGAQKKDPERPDYDPEAWDDEDFGAEAVSVAGFRIGRFPVTVYEYQEFLTSENREPSPDMNWEDQLRFPSRPVVRITQEEAREYCRYAGGYLPTEQEWEFAARGPGVKPRRYPWGSEKPDASRANYDDSWGKGPTPVGLFPAGATPEATDQEQIHDMAGNVLERVEGEQRLRGAAFSYGARDLRASYRYGVIDFRSYGVGFRCAREVSR